MHADRERLLLQVAVALGCLVPLTAGAMGVWLGPEIVIEREAPVLPDLASHFRYLSGLLLGIGACFAYCIPTIEQRSDYFALLGALVFIGGLARLFSLAANGLPSSPHLFGLVMELFIAPFLVIWQRRVARRFAETGLS